MEALNLHKAQSQCTQKVKNILIRSFPKESWGKHPPDREASHILRYSPKYYQSLFIEITPYNPLLSKIKKIKKLKRLGGQTGKSFKDSFPQAVWFNLVKNSRKEIEEAPQIVPKTFRIKLKNSFVRRLNAQKIKLFPNMSKISLARWRVFDSWKDTDPVISIKELFVSYIWNLRKLRNMEIPVRGDNFEQTKWFLKKLDEMGISLGRLKTLFLNVEAQNIEIQELFMNKNLLSHLTDLRLNVLGFDPIFASIPQVCKNLKSLSLEFFRMTNGMPEFLSLLTSIQHLPLLRGLKLGWPPNEKGIWTHFKPPSALRSLVLKLSGEHLINEQLSGNKSIVAHWDDLEKLQDLEFYLSGKNDDEMNLLKLFATVVLKKVRKVHSLKFFMSSSSAKIEPFFVGQVPHLYESLQKFEHIHVNYSQDQEPARLDLKILKPFRNLKKLKFEGGHVICDNVEEIVSLLEESQKEEEKSSVLGIRIKRMLDEAWLGETLRKIGDRKKIDMIITLSFSTEDLVGLLKNLCHDIQAVKMGEGLIIFLTLFKGSDATPLPAEELRDILKKYKDIQNLDVTLYNRSEVLRYSRLRGKEERFQIRQLSA